MIYLDHNATSPMLPEVLAVMQPWFGVPANAGSVHRLGQRATVALEEAREHVAALVGGEKDGVVFTSGATEANHGFLRGAHARHGGRIRCSRAEHPSVWAAAEALGMEPLQLDASGRVQVTVGPGIISVQAVNHETGVIQPSPVGAGDIVHVDATQAAGRIPLTMQGLQGLTLSAHKLGGPPGIGALVLPSSDDFPPWVHGGGQERGRRAGTVPTVLAVGFGEACRLARVEMESRTALWNTLRPLVEATVRSVGGHVVGDDADRVANTVCASFPGLLGEAVVQSLDLRGVCVSSGAACSSGSTQPSPVLVAMGHAEPRSGVRVSFGPRTTVGEVEAACVAMGEVVQALREAANWHLD
ncbi:MAG: cysteine desulfurase [Proteobacteria bacterium]|nr:cysteine desulfurase [Pseudomonadota bacterium]